MAQRSGDFRPPLVQRRVVLDIVIETTDETVQRLDVFEAVVVSGVGRELMGDPRIGHVQVIARQEPT